MWTDLTDFRRDVLEEGGRGLGRNVIMTVPTTKSIYARPHEAMQIYLE